MFKNVFSCSGTACIGCDIKIFKVQTVFPYPSGVVKKVHGKTNRFAIKFTDESVGSGIRSKNGFSNALFGCLNFMLCLFIARKLTNKLNDKSGIFSHSIANGELRIGDRGLGIGGQGDGETEGARAFCVRVRFFCQVMFDGF